MIIKMEQTNLFNTLDESTFTSLLNHIDYDDIISLYSIVDRRYKAKILQYLARSISFEISRKNNLQTIHEIKAFVKQLPILQSRQTQLDIMVNEFKQN